MKNLGEANKILDMEIERDRVSRKVFLFQEYYLQMVLNKFDINKSTKLFTTLLPSNS